MTLIHKLTPSTPFSRHKFVSRLLKSLIWNINKNNILFILNTVLIYWIHSKLDHSIQTIIYSYEDVYYKFEHLRIKQFTIKCISLILLLLHYGSIKINPWPLPNIFTNLLPYHKFREPTYFIPMTIKFKLEYQHLAQKFVFISSIAAHHSGLQNAIFHPYFHYIL